MFEHMEHRWGRRIVVEIPVRVGAANTALTKWAQLTNLSISGALVKADFRLRLLSRVRIVLGSAQNPERGPVSIDAYVARDYPIGMGVEWCEFASMAVTEMIRGAQPQFAELPRQKLSLGPLSESLLLIE